MRIRIKNGVKTKEYLEEPKMDEKENAPEKENGAAVGIAYGLMLACPLWIIACCVLYFVLTGGQ